MKKALAILATSIIASTFLNAKDPIANKNIGGANTHGHTAPGANITKAGYLISIGKENENAVNVQNSSAPPEWKTYTNEKYGFSFHYPASWIQQSKEYENIDRSSTTTLLGVVFKDTVSKTTFTLECHLAPNGLKLYNYALSQYQSYRGNFNQDARKIKVAKTTAIEASNILKKNGKGRLLSSPLRSIIIDFLDNKQTGEIEIQFLTPSSNEGTEIAKLNQLLSTFNFSK